MPRLPSLNRTLSSTIPIARGVADRAVRTAGPVVAGLAGRITSRLPRRVSPEESALTTFTPAPVAEAPTAEAPTAEAPTADVVPPPPGPKPTGPTPATVARNVSGPRPAAKRPAQRKPRSVPGAKLPVTRPST